MANENETGTDIRIDADRSWVSLGGVMGIIASLLTGILIVFGGFWSYHGTIRNSFEKTNENIRQQSTDLHDELETKLDRIESSVGELSKDQSQLRLQLRELEVRSSYRWTSLDQKAWVIELKERNPAMMVPAVSIQQSRMTHADGGR